MTGLTCGWSGIPAGWTGLSWGDSLLPSGWRVTVGWLRGGEVLPESALGWMEGDRCEGGAGRGLGAEAPIATVLAGGEYSTSESSMRETREFLLLRGILLQVWAACASCFVRMCFWRPVTVLYFLSQ